MTTKTRLLGGIGAIGATVLVSTALVAQEKSHEQHEMTPQQQAFMEAWQEYATPVAQHEKLVARAGHWTIKGKAWHAPGSEPETFEATSDFKPIMGGRYLAEKVHSEGPHGETFKGMGVNGYDNLRQAYVKIWLDNMGTGIHYALGTPSGNGGAIHYRGETPNVLEGRWTEARSVEERISDDRFVITAYETSPDGEEYKSMVLKYTRAAAEPAKMMHDHDHDHGHDHDH